MTEGTEKCVLRFLLFTFLIQATAQGESYLKAELIGSHVFHLNWPGLGTGTVAVETTTNLTSGFRHALARDLPASVSSLTMDASGVSQACYRLNINPTAPPRYLFEDFENTPALSLHDGAARGGWCDVASAPASPGLALRIGWESNHFAFQEIHNDSIVNTQSTRSKYRAHP